MALAVVRDPRPRTLVLGLAAATLVAFCFLTSMHERYSYGALVFLMLLVPDVRMRWLGLAFGIVFTLNLLAAVPPTPAIGEWLPVAGPLGIAGSDRDAGDHRHPGGAPRATAGPSGGGRRRTRPGL